MDCCWGGGDCCCCCCCALKGLTNETGCGCTVAVTVVVVGEVASHITDGSVTVVVVVVVVVVVDCGGKVVTVGLVNCVSAPCIAVSSIAASGGWLALGLRIVDVGLGHRWWWGWGW